MDILNHFPARVRTTIDGGASVTAFAALANTRWVMTNFAFGWANMATSATLALWETSQTGSMADGAVFFQTIVSTTQGWGNFELGPNGVEASAVFSRMGITTGAILGTITCIANGYYKGS
jgi:hypothetical protein